MITLTYATTNLAKIDMMARFLQPLNIVIKGIDKTLPIVPESGNIPLENARQKALTYYDILKKPLFSCDSGLYFEGLPSQLQPGTNVRTVNGKRLSDNQMIKYYSKLAKQYGTLKAQYKNAICLVLDKDKIIECDGEELSGEKFLIASQPHKMRNSGYPIDSLAIHILTNKYYYDLSEIHRNFSMEKGFQDFFIKHLYGREKDVLLEVGEKNYE